MHYYLFDDTADMTIAEVGGKAKSLIHMKRGGFNVPDGAVLTVSFFQPWTTELQETLTFDDGLQNPDQFKDLASRLKKLAVTLLFSEEQKSIIMSILSNFKDCDRFAVRSSSPEEDLAGASFAGGYETLLGVRTNDILDAVKTAFISCLDERVFFYKHQNGFDPSIIRIAVVLQTMISSDVSGVGFSLNPLNNCYDEAVINANSGLGESVVSGMVTPDEYIVDKHQLTVIQETIGSKSKAIVLEASGGTKVVQGTGESAVLNHTQTIELTKLISEVEAYYGFPVDIEWAVSDEVLYLLQSRPITTYIPLIEGMQTAPGEDKILYIDGSLTKQGITTPISVLGCDCIEMTQVIMFNNMIGQDVTSDIKGGLATTKGGRMYVNASSSIRFQGIKRVIKMWSTVDVMTTEILEQQDLTSYIPKKLPTILKGAMWGTIKNNLGAVKKMRQAAKDPVAYKNWYQPFEDDFDNYLLDVSKKDLGINLGPDKILKGFLDLLDRMLPMTYAAEMARSSLTKQLMKTYEDGSEKMAYLERSLPDNGTIDMGLSMYALSQMDEIKGRASTDILDTIHRGAMTKSFSVAWENYLNKYGCRAANEMDTGVPRLSENIETLIDQLVGMSQVDDDMNPLTIYNRSKALRESTYESIVNDLHGGALKKFTRNYNTLVQLGGKREALKYWFIRSLTAIRELIIIEAAQLAKDGKLSSPEEAFWLHYKELIKCRDLDRQSIGLCISHNKDFYQQLNNVHAFPQLIDSRGKILTLPNTEAKEGQIIGQPISPGLVTGRVKVLHTPDEKPLLPGEIMVTKATDPGWTPLFINASAILLEVGGLLQHGALVAREYGKPCIAGIDRVMDVLKDGQLIQVDATRGIITLLEEGHEEEN